MRTNVFNQGLGFDFLCVGSMGHASAIAYGIACAKRSSSVNFETANAVVCFDGDGGALMHLGQMAINGQLGKNNAGEGQKTKKLIHILINNGMHESVGGQPSVGMNIDFVRMARSVGYDYAELAEKEEIIIGRVKEIVEMVENDCMENTFFLQVNVRPGSRKDLGRPKSTPVENKEAFMKKNFSL